MINIAICDDDFNICGQIYNTIIRNYGASINHIDDFSNGKELIDSIADGRIYNIIILDLKMDILDGISTGNIIRSFTNHKDSIIIFITSHEANPAPIVDIHPFAYIKKPVDEAILHKKLAEAFDMLSISDNYTILHRKSGNYRINNSEIYFLQSAGRKCSIYFFNDHLQYSKSMAYVYNEILKNNKLFIRVHTSYAINMKYLKCITPLNVELINGRLIPIGRSYKKDLIKKYNELFNHLL